MSDIFEQEVLVACEEHGKSRKEFTRQERDSLCTALTLSAVRELDREANERSVELGAQRDTLITYFVFLFLEVESGRILGSFVPGTQAFHELVTVKPFDSSGFVRGARQIIRSALADMPK